MSGNVSQSRDNGAAEGQPRFLRRWLLGSHGSTGLGLARLVASLAAGLLLAAAFPPLAASESAWIALIPLLIVAWSVDPVDAFRHGFMTGLVFWLVSISWLLRLCRTGGPLLLVVLGWILLSAYCALYIGAFAMIASSLFRRLRGGVPVSGVPAGRLAGVALVLILPVFWVGLEFLRATLFSGFPWNPLGVSQYRNLAVIQLAELGGVYAVSAILVVMNVALALTCVRAFAVAKGRRVPRMSLELMTGLLLCALCWSWGCRVVSRMRREPGGTEVRVAAIQPNIAQMRKWPPEYALEIYDRLEMQTRLALTGRPDLIVWPETAVPVAATTSPEARAFIAGLTSQGAPILAGSMEIEPTTDGYRCYNSSLFFRVDGSLAGSYRKRHLVPFGEYVPLGRLIPVLKRLAPLGYNCDAGDTATIFELADGFKMQGVGGSDERSGDSERLAGIAFSVLICFEDAVPSLARDAVRRGAGFLVNQTNDAWFDGAWAQAQFQHMAHCVFRCVENRVPAVRAANSGVTCFIDRMGLVEYVGQDQAVCGTPAIKSSGLRVRLAPVRRTIYTRFGDWVFALPCGVAAVCALFGIALGAWRGRRVNRP